MELNTGGMARKAIDGIYPSEELLALLRKRDVPVTVSSDAHSARDIDFAYDTAIATAWQAGYRELTFLGEKGYETGPISTVTKIVENS